MRERRIFLNIDHVPKIWGVPYPKVFATVGLLIIATLLGNALTGNAGTTVKMLVVAAAVILSGSLHIVFILMERVDALDKETPYIKDELNSQDCSHQTVIILPKSPANVQRKGKQQI